MALKFNGINRNFLTFVLLIIFSVLVSKINCDLAPKEEDDDDVPQEQLDLKRDISLTTLKPDNVSKLGFIHAFVAAFSVIIVSEIGDKTFFIAAIMSMKYPRLTVFSGAISALALMTVLSAVFGTVFIQFIPPHITRWISVLLFVLFGLKMLHEGYKMTATDQSEEMEEVQHDIRKREEEVSKESVKVTQDAETGLGSKKLKTSPFAVMFRIFVQAFTMTFVAEWGDRSQITTIILSAREDLWGVITGGVIGHAICTGIGVLGGRMIAQKISVKTVTIIGGVVFLLFAITSTIWDPNAEDTPAAPAEILPGNVGN